MKLRTFMDEAGSGAQRIEDQINEWFQSGEVEVVKTETLVCAVTRQNCGEWWPCLTVAVWYNEQHPAT